MRQTSNFAYLVLLCALVGNAEAQDNKFTISSYAIEGNSLLPQSTIDSILATQTGSDKNLDDINAAADLLREAYEAAGYPIVKVFPPPQKTTEGQIKLKVVEGEIGKVTVTGNKHFDEANIRRSLPMLTEGVKPHIPSIVAGITAANENPVKQLTVNFQSAEDSGKVDSVVNVADEAPEKFTLGYDNMGAAATGTNRISLGWQNANLFDGDHMASLQFITSPDHPRKGQQLSGAWRTPFYKQGLSVDIFTAISHSSASTNVGFGSTQFVGRGYTIGLRLNQALTSAGEYRHRLIYGVDFKDFDSTCQGVVEGECGTVTTIPASIAYVASYATPRLQLNGNLGWSINIPGGPHGSADEYAAARANANPHWNVWRANASAQLNLPANLMARTAVSGQWTQDRLVAGEQFGIGGAYTVRGYRERTYAGDYGYIASLELYSPDFGPRLSQAMGDSLGGSTLRGLVFYDLGQATDQDSPRRKLASFGVGLRANLARNFTARIDVGVVRDQVLADPSTKIDREVGDAFAHLNMQFMF
jgi:hemolysin activation/secretion protein